MYISDVTIVFHNHVLFDLYAIILLGCITCTGTSECIDVAYCYRCSVVCGLRNHVLGGNCIPLGKGQFWWQYNKIWILV